MKIAIPDDVRRKTTKCEHDFGCLATGRCGDRNMCHVANALGADVLELASAQQVFCNYRTSFGFCQLCTCPVRQFLYTTWGNWRPQSLS